MVSYDIIGSKDKAVAIVEIPKGFNRKQKEIAEEILKRHKNVKSVLKKTSERKGVLRVRSYRLIVGEKNTEVVHVEYGYRLKLDPRKVYFSPREGTERQRIAGMVKPKETVMVMFAGIGPLAIAIAKKQPDTKQIIAIEINPDAVRYMKENIRLNKLEGKIIPILGDVKVKCKDWYGKCNRVLMPLPHKSELFIDVAKKCLKRGYIHMYIIEDEDKIEKRVKEIVKKIKPKNYKIRKVLPYAPRVNKYCIDIKI